MSEHDDDNPVDEQTEPTKAGLAKLDLQRRFDKRSLGRPLPPPSSRATEMRRLVTAYGPAKLAERGADRMLMSDRFPVGVRWIPYLEDEFLVSIYEVDPQDLSGGSSRAARLRVVDVIPWLLVPDLDRQRIFGQLEQADTAVRIPRERDSTDQVRSLLGMAQPHPMADPAAQIDWADLAQRLASAHTGGDFPDVHVLTEQSGQRWLLALGHTLDDLSSAHPWFARLLGGRALRLLVGEHGTSTLARI